MGSEREWLPPMAARSWPADAPRAEPDLSLIHISAGQYHRFLALVIKVGVPVYGVLIDIREHIKGNLAQPCLGIQAGIAVKPYRKPGGLKEMEQETNLPRLEEGERLRCV